MALRFSSNGWGGKYELPEDDDTVGDADRRAAGAPVRAFDFVLEGGAVDHDGDGTVLTTGQCLLNPNRNPAGPRPQAEAALGEAFGAEAVSGWATVSLNDHTDGHVDNLARFVAPGVVACRSPAARDDPNAEALRRRCAQARAGDRRRGPQAGGRCASPSPGLVSTTERRGRARPSHMNFLIANERVIVPIYGDRRRATCASRRCKQLFPDRKVVGLPSRGARSSTGGGSFHCITQQEPA